MRWQGLKSKDNSTALSIDRADFVKHLFCLIFRTVHWNSTERKRLQKEYNRTNNTEGNVFINTILHNK